jgi:hypothetical protein
VQRRKPGFQRTDVKYNVEEERFRQLGDNGEDIHDLSKQPREDSKWKGKTGKNLLSIAVAFGIDRGVLADGMQLQMNQMLKGRLVREDTTACIATAILDVNMMLMTGGPIPFSCIVTLREIVWEDLDMPSGTTKLLECLMVDVITNVLIVTAGFSDRLNVLRSIWET